MTANTRHLRIHICIHIYIHTYLRKSKENGTVSHTYSECHRNSTYVHISELYVLPVFYINRVEKQTFANGTPLYTFIENLGGSDMISSHKKNACLSIKFLLGKHNRNCNLFWEFNLQLHLLQMSCSDSLFFLCGSNIHRKRNVPGGENTASCGLTNN